GGTAKAQRLATRFPNHPRNFNLLYLSSPHLPRDLGPLVWLARRRGIPVVVNQNGVGYPAWAGDASTTFNAPVRRALDVATHVLYQSAFCKASADAFVGAPRGMWEILYNAVDTTTFTPSVPPPAGGPVLLLGGDQTQAYRAELALRTLAELVASYDEARLLVTGRLVAPANGLVDELGLRDRVELVGRYAQRDAPALLRRAHVLLHTQMNDSCPSLVIEAMACGLPVVYSRSGGTVELVGDVAGIGVPHEATWERLVPPEPRALAEAVSRVLADHDRYRTAARQRAVAEYDLEPWFARHEELFAQLVAQRQRGRR
ncbi:MAG: glycosyltransferase family 4 protein, partial [Thermoleophilia bacterium]|nr:glycosyltransferase family 4 protein [Thermoleophilia bacterium]